MALIFRVLPYSTQLYGLPGGEESFPATAHITLLEDNLLDPVWCKYRPRSTRWMGVFLAWPESPSQYRSGTLLRGRPWSAVPCLHYHYPNHALGAASHHCPASPVVLGSSGACCHPAEGQASNQVQPQHRLLAENSRTCLCNSSTSPLYLSRRMRTSQPTTDGVLVREQNL